MSTTQYKATPVAKEEVFKLRFPMTDVLSDKDERFRRWYNLNRALTLGNNHHGKVRIVFDLDNGETCEVNTTIWALTDEHISLKGGTTIPLAAIREVYMG